MACSSQWEGLGTRLAIIHAVTEAGLGQSWFESLVVNLSRSKDILVSFPTGYGKSLPLCLWCLTFYRLRSACLTAFMMDQGKGLTHRAEN